MFSIRNISSRHRAWALVLAWVAAIYLTSGQARSVNDWLRQWPAYPVFIAILCLLFLTVFITAGLEKRALNRKQWFFTGLIAALYTATVFYLQIPAERVHLVQYGICAVLFYRALRHHMGAGRAVFPAWILTALAGFLDEVIQGCTPGRYFGWGDVILNAWSGVMALGLNFVLNGRK